MRFEAALAALVAILAAGCIETNPPPFVSARFHWDDAVAVARTWDEGARLVRVATFEARDADEALETMSGPGKGLWREDDPSPGDGWAVGWFYEFRTDDASRPSLLVTFARAGVLTTERDADQSGQGRIDAWPIDSNHASAIAAADVAEWPGHRASPRLQVGHALLADDEGRRVFWLWMADDHATGWSATRIVDAVSGEIFSR